MNARWIYGAFSMLAVIMGLHNLLTGGGSLIFGSRATTLHGLPKLHFTGVAAYVEGAIFIAVGLCCLYFAWRGKPGGDDSE